MPSTLQIITAVLAVYGAALATYSLVVQRRPHLRVVAEQDFDFDQSEGGALLAHFLTVCLRATNIGARSITIVDVRWRSTSGKEDAIAHLAEPIEGPWTSAPVPVKLGDGEVAEFYFDWLSVALTVRSEGHFEVEDGHGRIWTAQPPKALVAYVKEHRLTGSVRFRPKR